MKKYIIGLLIGMIFLVGCTNIDYCEYERACAEIHRIDIRERDYYENRTRILEEEVREHKFYWIPPEEFIYDIDGNCMLIVTEGEKPSYNYMFKKDKELLRGYLISGNLELVIFCIANLMKEGKYQIIVKNTEEVLEDRSYK